MYPPLHAQGGILRRSLSESCLNSPFRGGEENTTFSGFPSSLPDLSSSPTTSIQGTKVSTNTHSEKDIDYRFFEACQKNETEVLELILNKYTINVNLKNLHGTTPLILAARYNNITIISLLLAHENIDVNAQNTDGRTALAMAAWFNHSSAVKLLLSDSRIDTSLKGVDGKTALQLAQTMGHKSVIALFPQA